MFGSYPINILFLTDNLLLKKIRPNHIYFYWIGIIINSHNTIFGIYFVYLNNGFFIITDKFTRIYFYILT